MYFPRNDEKVMDMVLPTSDTVAYSRSKCGNISKSQSAFFSFKGIVWCNMWRDKSQEDEEAGQEEEENL